MPAAAGGGGHAVEGGGDVGAHPLAVAVDERAAVAAAAGHGRAPPPAPAGAAASATADASTALAARRRPRGGRRPPPSPAPARRSRGPGKRDRSRARVDAVRPAGGERGRPRPGQVGGLVDVGRVGQAVGQRRRRQQPRQVVAHRAGRRDRRQVGGPLHPPLPVTAPAIATSASAPASSTKAPPSARISAWPDSPARSPRRRIAVPSMPDPGGDAPWRAQANDWRTEATKLQIRSAEPFRAAAVDRSTNRPRSPPCGDSRCPARSAPRSDSPCATALAALLVPRARRCGPGQQARRQAGRERDPRPHDPHHDPGPHPLQPQRRDERQVHLHRRLPLHLAPARRPGRGQADRPGQARHDQTTRRQTQVTFKGRPLYSFSGDSRAGDVNGEGIKDVGTWHAAVTAKAPPSPNRSLSRAALPR